MLLLHIKQELCFIDFGLQTLAVDSLHIRGDNIAAQQTAAEIAGACVDWYLQFGAQFGVRGRQLLQLQLQCCQLLKLGHAHRW